MKYFHEHNTPRSLPVNYGRLYLVWSYEEQENKRAPLYKDSYVLVTLLLNLPVLFLHVLL